MRLNSYKVFVCEKIVKNVIFLKPKVSLKLLVLPEILSLLSKDKKKLKILIIEELEPVPQCVAYFARRSTLSN